MISLLRNKTISFCWFYIRTFLLTIGKALIERIGTGMM